MSSRKNFGSYVQHHQRAPGLHDAADHPHLLPSEVHEMHDHRKGHENSSQALEYPQEAGIHSDLPSQDSASGNDDPGFGREDVAILAHGLWEARGCPVGSPDDDWFRATQQLRVRGAALAT